MNELTIYMVQRWRGEEAPSQWPGDEYLNWPLSEAEEDLTTRGYVLRDQSKHRPGLANWLAIYVHPVTGVGWGLSAR